MIVNGIRIEEKLFLKMSFENITRYSFKRYTHEAFICESIQSHDWVVDILTIYFIIDYFLFCLFCWWRGDYIFGVSYFFDRLAM